MQTSILSVVPVAGGGDARAFVVSLFVERAFGTNWATFATALILLQRFGSVFSATLGYSRIPYAAALDGNFFSVFARVHPTKRFPHVSLVALGATAIVFCLSLEVDRRDSRHPGDALPHPICRPGGRSDDAASALGS